MVYKLGFEKGLSILGDCFRLQVIVLSSNKVELIGLESNLDFQIQAKL